MTELKQLIEPAELHTYLSQNHLKHICIVDLGSETTYLNGHIPGAVHLPFQTLLSGEPPTPGKLANIDKLTQVFSHLGLNDDTHFIVYDDEGGGWAGRFIWTLDVIGHAKYSYVNGGIHAWTLEGYELEKNANTPIASDVNISIDRSVIAEIPEILEGIKTNAITVWDARSLQEYSGTKVLAAKAGHIPGAINCEWTTLMNQNLGLKIREDARSLLAELGIDGSKPIVTHCQSHHRSGFTYLVGKLLGFTIKGYHGSWSEWGNHPDTPVERS